MTRKEKKNVQTLIAGNGFVVQDASEAEILDDDMDKSPPPSDMRSWCSRK
jgi:hypothetical protein